MTNSAELLPCPMDGRFSWLPEHRLRLADGLQDRWGQATEFAAGCEGCDIYTPQCKTREEAIAAWNTRASSRPSLQGDELERVARAIAEHFSKSFSALIEDDGYGVIVNLPPIELFRFNASNVARAALEAMGGGWRPIAEAPKDGTLVLLLVDYSDDDADHYIDDSADGLGRTIGHNNDDNVDPEEAEGWQFAGWCWTHDHYVEGRGRPIRWMPLPSPTLAAGAGGMSLVERLKRAARHCENAGAIAAIEEAADELERLQQRLEVLEGALRPFAEHEVEDWQHDEEIEIEYSNFTAGDFRKARAALGEGR